ncbi:MAG TPA: DUF2283 domain-containing protein, partial [Desulfurococcales archaeon]|nr:DUF2283 domain-containing protein [Desulfurococcales archaeon]
IVEYKIKLDNVWVEYDRVNDILYINFCGKSEEAEETILINDNIIVGVKEGRVVNITIMNLTGKE